MRELLEYRTNLIDRLVAAAHEFHEACAAVGDADAPLQQGSWSAHQVATHTRDIHTLVYGLRVQRTASEDDPEFPNFDGEAHMAEHYSAAEPLNGITAELVQHVEEMADMLRRLPAEAWSRPSRHAMLGHGITLQTWVEKDLAHIEEHLASIRQQKEQAK